MSLKVLLADDNITAQRMGCKILSDAGYSVVPVSNGAAAVKKIASEKPELIILDVYMPGYTGLEVCEKVKSAAETARIPVLLTITSMEPFRPEDGNRVKADGVLTKPFEATDLLAVVRKLAEKLHPAEPAEAPTTVKMAAVQDFSDASYSDWKSEAGADEPAAKPAEISDDVGSAPVLGIEGLDAASILTVESSPAPFAVESQPAEVPIFDLNAPAPAFDLQHAELPEAAPVIVPPAELEYTSAPQAGPTEVAPAAEFEPTLQAGADQVPIVRDSALATDPSDFMQFATKFGQEHPEEIPVGIAMEEPAHEDAIAEIHASVAESGPVAEAASFEHEMRQAFETPGGAAAAPAREPEPEAEAGIDTQPIEIFPEPYPAPATEIEAAPEHPAENHELTQRLVSQFVAELEAAQREAPLELEMEPPSAAAPAPASMDEQHIAEVVERVLARYKDELVAAILRELQS
ncbi:MAG: response regulator [Acidobacteriia bacterium]|nr:response regulator [Terriglobia bacterium]